MSKLLFLLDEMLGINCTSDGTCVFALRHPVVIFMWLGIKLNWNNNTGTCMPSLYLCPYVSPILGVSDCWHLDWTLQSFNYTQCTCYKSNSLI